MTEINGMEPVITEAGVQAAAQERAAKVNALTLAADMIMASPEEFSEAIDYVIARTETERRYGWGLHIQLACFEDLSPSEQGNFSDEQMELYRERSKLTKDSIVNAMLPLPQ